MPSYSSGLHPQLRTILFHFLKECKKKGYSVRVIDGYHNENQQNYLYSQGRLNDKDIVTAHNYPYSLHNWGLAFHICRNDGKGYFSNHGYWFNHVAEIGKKYHLTWGGNLPILPDKTHFQLDIFGDSGYHLEKKYGTPTRFINIWGETINSDISYKKLYLKFMRPTTNWIKSVQKKLGIEITGSITNYEEILDKTLNINMVENYNHKIVINIQRRLCDLGYYTGEMNSIYTKEVKEAVKKLQEDIGLLKCDGIIRKKDDVWKVMLGIIQK